MTNFELELLTAAIAEDCERMKALITGTEIIEEADQWVDPNRVDPSVYWNAKFGHVSFEDWSFKFYRSPIHRVLCFAIYFCDDGILDSLLVLADYGKKWDSSEWTEFVLHLYKAKGLDILDEKWLALLSNAKPEDIIMVARLFRCFPLMSKFATEDMLNDCSFQNLLFSCALVSKDMEAIQYAADHHSNKKDMAEIIMLNGTIEIADKLMLPKEAYTGLLPKLLLNRGCRAVGIENIKYTIKHSLYPEEDLEKAIFKAFKGLKVEDFELLLTMTAHTFSPSKFINNIFDSQKYSSSSFENEKIAYEIHLLFDYFEIDFDEIHRSAVVEILKFSNFYGDIAEKVVDWALARGNY